MDEFLELLGYSGYFQYVYFIVDVVLTVGLFLVPAIILYKKIKSKLVFFLAPSYLIVSAAIIILDLPFAKLAIIASIAMIVLAAILSTNTKQNSVDDELPKPVEKIGSNFVDSETEKAQLIDELLNAIEYLSSRKIGAIITIEKEISLSEVTNRSVIIDAVVSSELLKTIFFPNTALHDGAVIIEKNRIKCAGAYYQTFTKKDVENDQLKELGTRHRAAVYISKETDAFSIVVSEETGKISSTFGGAISTELQEAELRTALENHINVRL